MFMNLNLSVVKWFFTSFMEANSSLAACFVITLLLCDVTFLLPFSIGLESDLVATYICASSYTFLIYVSYF